MVISIFSWSIQLINNRSQARRQREQEEAERAEAIAIKAAEELDKQIQADAIRQMLAKEQSHKFWSNGSTTHVQCRDNEGDIPNNGNKWGTVRYREIVPSTTW